MVKWLHSVGIRSENSMHTTFAETRAASLPKSFKVHKRHEELQKQRNKGMKRVPQSWVLSYDKSVDIWTLGKILQNLLRGVP